jgi:hypothetical protein
MVFGFLKRLFSILFALLFFWKKKNQNAYFDRNIEFAVHRNHNRWFQWKKFLFLALVCAGLCFCLQ